MKKYTHTQAHLYVQIFYVGSFTQWLWLVVSG